MKTSTGREFIDVQYEDNVPQLLNVTYCRYT